MKGRGGYLSLLSWGLALFGLYAFVDVVNGINAWDECWFLQVVHRLASGDVLYRDVFYATPPLSVYLTTLFTSLFGSEVLVLKAIMGLIYIAIVLISGRILREVSSTRGFPLFFAVAFLTLAPPWLNTAPYTPLANLFFLVCLSAALSWMRNEEGAGEVPLARRRMEGSMISLAIGGMAAGLSFVSKQNIGFYALAAFFFSVIIGLWRKERMGPKLLLAFTVILFSFSLTVFLILLPVGLSGGWAKFLDYGFLNRGTYLELAEVSYLGGIGILKYLIHRTNSVEQWMASFKYTLFFWPFLVFGGLLVAFPRKPHRKRQTAVVTIFVAMGFLAVFPRADLPHLGYVVPELLIGLLYSWNLLKPNQATGWVKPIQASLVVWIGIGMSLILATSIAKIESPEYAVSTLPHFGNVLMKESFIHEIRTSASALSDAVSRGERPFLLSPRAGLFYLVSGRKNLTPFDFPLVTAFGRDGEADVISSLARGSLSSVWVDPEMSIMPRLRPRRLLAYLRDNMKPGEKLGVFTPYRFR
jgi:hypothetical protein